MIMPSLRDAYISHNYINTEKVPLIEEEVRDMGIDEFGVGKIVQLRNANGDKLFPISSGDMELRRSYNALADRVLYLENKLEVMESLFSHLERKIKLNDSGIAKII